MWEGGIPSKTGTPLSCLWKALHKILSLGCLTCFRKATRSGRPVDRAWPGTGLFNQVDMRTTTVETGLQLDQEAK